MRVAAEDALDRGWGVEACGYRAAEGFNAGDGFGGGPGDDDVDCAAQLVGVLWMTLIRAIVGPVCEHTRPSSFTPCLLTPCRHRDDLSSFIVIGLEASSRPWSIQDCMRSRLMGDISTLKLPIHQPLYPIETHGCPFRSH